MQVCNPCCHQGWKKCSPFRLRRICFFQMRKTEWSQLTKKLECFSMENILQCRHHYGRKFHLFLLKESCLFQLRRIGWNQLTRKRNCYLMKNTLQWMSTQTGGLKNRPFLLRRKGSFQMKELIWNHLKQTLNGCPMGKMVQGGLRQHCHAQRPSFKNKCFQQLMGTMSNSWIQTIMAVTKHKRQSNHQIWVHKQFDWFLSIAAPYRPFNCEVTWP